MATIIKQSFYLLTIFSILISCKEEKRIVEKIDFKTNYKFSWGIESQLEKDTTSWKHQISAWAYASKGDYKNTLIQQGMDKKGEDLNFTSNQIDSINAIYNKVNASDYIVEQSKENQIIIINEDHTNTLHRVYIRSLLKRLYENGYKNFGYEALSYQDNLDSLQHIRKYPVRKSILYKDPQLGNIVREAIEIGYTVFAYEAQSEDALHSRGKEREIEQAQNIQKRIAANPNEKFLIHCGWSHNYEGVIGGNWEKAMAARLTEYTGINPLTIDQIAFSEKGNSKFNDPLLKALNITESTIILNKDDSPFKGEKRNGWRDISLFHPNTNYINGRPDWLFQNGNKNVSIEFTNIDIEFPVMVLAFKKGEDIKIAIPVDITEVTSNIEECHLGLKIGGYTIVVTNGNESLKFEQNVK